MKEIVIGRDGPTGKLRLTVGNQSAAFGQQNSVPRSVSQEHARLTVGDDGTLSAHDGKKVLAEGTIEMPTDWASSLISPIMLANPTLEDL